LKEGGQRILRSPEGGGRRNDIPCGELLQKNLGG